MNEEDLERDRDTPEEERTNSSYSSRTFLRLRKHNTPRCFHGLSIERECEDAEEDGVGEQGIVLEI